MLPEKWMSPCGSHCTRKYAALTEIPWRIFCKKACNGDTETWEECLEECDKMCYKDPVLKDKKWSAHLDRSPGAENSSLKCFHACASGCGYKLNISSETIGQATSKRPQKPPVETRSHSSPQECIFTEDEERIAASFSA